MTLAEFYEITRDLDPNMEMFMQTGEDYREVCIAASGTTEIIVEDEKEEVFVLIACYCHEEVTDGEYKPSIVEISLN